MAICVRDVLAGGLAPLALMLGCARAENSAAPGNLRFEAIAGVGEAVIAKLADSRV